MKSIIPIKVNYSPIRKLAIIPFEKNPDKIYSSLELQEIVQAGKVAYRVIAYRNDHFVDVYDDYAMDFQPDEKFDVTENGLNKHIQTAIDNVKFEKINNCELISFEFNDMESRRIKFFIEEHSKRKTKPMNLLAPVGYGSKNPHYLPLFFMSEFDFVRRGKTKVDCSIDGRAVSIDRFSFPMNMQFRYFVRYSNDCLLLEFANTDCTELMEVELDDNNAFTGEFIKYYFDKPNVLNKISANLPNGDVNIEFSPSFDLTASGEGTFKILPAKELGYIEGKYRTLMSGDEITIDLAPSGGWKSVPTSLLAKLILSSKSIFSVWSKNYSLTAKINIANKTINAKWSNTNE